MITGGTVENTTLIADNESGEPQTGEQPKSKIPLVGAVMIALLPMAGCAVAIYAVSSYLGASILGAMASEPVVHLALPTSGPAFFDMLHQSIALVERLVNAIAQSDLTDWQTLLFLYLAACLTVRMAPLSGNIRGALGAIALAGIAVFVIGKTASSAAGMLNTIWTLMSFSVAVLLFLLIVSLLMTGIISLIKAFLTHDS